MRRLRIFGFVVVVFVLPSSCNLPTELTRLYSSEILPPLASPPNPILDSTFWYLQKIELLNRFYIPDTTSAEVRLDSIFYSLYLDHIPIREGWYQPHKGDCGDAAVPVAPMLLVRLGKKDSRMVGHAFSLTPPTGPWCAENDIYHYNF